MPIFNVHANELIEDHLKVAKIAAKSVYRRVHGAIEFDELLSIANLSLVQAAHAYDETRGMPFVNYARFIVKRRMLDYLREVHPRGRYKERPDLWSLDNVMRDDNNLLLGEMIADELAIAPDVLFGEDFRRLTASLNPRYRWIVEQHFLEDRELQDIAREMGVTANRVSQMYRIALMRIRTQVVRPKHVVDLAAA